MGVCILRILYNTASCQTVSNAFSKSSNISCVILFLLCSIVTLFRDTLELLYTGVFLAKSKLFGYDYIVFVEVSEEVEVNNFS